MFKKSFLYTVDFCSVLLWKNQSQIIYDHFSSVAEYTIHKKKDNI